MNKKDLYFVLTAFFSWRALTVIFLFLGLYFFPHSQNFLGGGLANYSKNPLFWAWANFDGEHYLSIAQWGYKPLQYFFFPIFPLVVKLLGQILGSSLKDYLLSGLLLNHLFFFFALLGFWKLIRLDYNELITKRTLILLLIFPTSFFFVSFYTESLFFVLIIWSFYFARKGNWISASLLAGISSATRVIGILLFPCLLIEWFWVNKNKKDKNFLSLLVICLFSFLGLLIYMYFLKVKTGDPLEFFHTIGLFGTQRATSLILLPQVFYRYIFKILPSLDVHNFLSSFPIILEFLTGTAFLIFSIVGFFKLRFSYWFFLVGGYLIPALSGSFSSLPRYVLVLFPAFIFLALWLNKAPKILKIAFYALLLMGLAIAESFFVRGFWLS